MVKTLCNWEHHSMWNNHTVIIQEAYLELNGNETFYEGKLLYMKILEFIRDAPNTVRHKNCEIIHRKNLPKNIFENYLF
jgi:hypothetical protein